MGNHAHVDCGISVDLDEDFKQPSPLQVAFALLQALRTGARQTDASE